MRKGNLYWFLVLILLVSFGVYFFSLKSKSSNLSYARDVKPIINKHCISCHGGVKKQGKFSLLFQEEAFQKTASGKPSIVPYHPEKSEFIARLHAKDVDERMPLNKEPLTEGEIKILTQWVKEGAKWETHWAYLPIVKPIIPSALSFWERIQFWKENPVKNNIDEFVLEELHQKGLSPSEKAEKFVLVRRLSLDILGLPPTAKMVEDFEKVSSQKEYEAFVDQLLQSNAFGEKWASVWLDLARYSDSRGYQKDNGRTIWPYRDWVIKSFNANISFKDFVEKQLAGDLLKNPTDDDYIATGFHRNTMNNDETGTVDEEFRVAAVLDRVNTTWDALHGTTFSCVQCHSHPYDPIKHEEYYQFMAFLNNTRDEDTGDEAPNIRKFNQTEDLNKLLAFQNEISNLSQVEKLYINRFVKFLEPRFHAHYADNFINGALLGGVQIGLRNTGTCRIPNIKTDSVAQLLIQYTSKNPKGKLLIREGGLTGKIIFQTKLDTTSKPKFLTIKWPKSIGRKDYYLEAQNSTLAGKAEDVFRISWFAFMPQINLSKESYQHFLELLTVKTDNFPIYLEMPNNYKRKTNVFTRGNWLMLGKEVQANVPGFMHPFKDEWPRNRLGLAKWVTDSNNPLFARNVANRFWEQIFGIGIVETLEDFGSQGAKPSHQDLLNYLAYQFIFTYDMKPKPLIKEIVCSATYQQSSKASRKMMEIDPSNKFLARGPRFRISSEQVRDQALAVAGMLNRKMYGKPIMPYQPEGIWQAVNSSLKWKQDSTSEQYRRAIYIFTRRTGPYPSQFTFDSPSREVCMVRRIRTNTPLQALVLLNDPVFVEIAKNLALQMQKQSQFSLEKKIENLYFKMFWHSINDKDLKTLTHLFETGKIHFSKEAKFKQIAELKALEMVASAMLNLDEFVTKM
ncbi:PSD1 and planctomycete cytochrome C domain-containing protein [Aquirufa sp. ROCK-SH2]